MTSRHRYIGVVTSSHWFRFTAASPMAGSLGRVEQRTPARPGDLVTAAIGLPLRTGMRLRLRGAEKPPKGTMGEDISETGAVTCILACSYPTTRLNGRISPCCCPTLCTMASSIKDIRHLGESIQRRPTED
ncbi:hypothetical protein F9C07_1940 [Aspergillus flavus]|uniref:Uncharacterized protein n=1 Tax=Aspergillus flavus (strain ATCC 200026 / FGSC A1120 / IAM 13836 / NRRL 3357 / JCM 12722 / SRRC 167) TaxID=332952 RepID=A0A7U2QSG7_ASPFN|nr:hypothetical protein F9C07_1940 [Aspergillus flavus]